MGQTSFLYSFEYLPRQGRSDPRIKDYELFTSLDGRTWGQPVLEGTLPNTEAAQSIAVTPVEARYFKLVGVSGYSRKAAAAAELGFFGTSAAPALEPE